MQSVDVFKEESELLVMLHREIVLRALHRELARAPIVIATAASLDFLFIYSKASSPELELLQKMGEALQLPRERWKTLAASTLDLNGLKEVTKGASARFVVVFGFEMKLALQAPSELILAPTLGDLLQDPEKKKVLWAQFKNALSKLESFRK